MEILERFYSYRSDSETVVIGDRFVDWAVCVCIEGENCPTPAQDDPAKPGIVELPIKILCILYKIIQLYPPQAQVAKPASAALPNLGPIFTPAYLPTKSASMRQSEEHKIKIDNVQLDNIPIPPTGNTRQAGLRRLRTQRKDLHTRVLAHEISVNAAMVEAGFRRFNIYTITVSIVNIIRGQCLTTRSRRFNLAYL